VTHPKQAAALDLIRQGLTNTEIGRRLHMERQAVGAIRRAAGIPNVPQQPLTLEQKWATFTRPVDGGHLEWTGERGTSAGTPVLRYREKAYTACAVAFRIHTGRDPEGYVMPECDHPGCVAPDHQEDEPGRMRLREQLRYLTGGAERAATCRHGHDQAVHGRYAPNGTAYCHRCNLDAKQRARGEVQPA
jgi:hypothetical protein